MLLCRTGLSPANQAKPGLQSFCLTIMSFLYPVCKNFSHIIFLVLKNAAQFAMPFHLLRPPLFCLISPEAYLPEKAPLPFRVIKSAKARQKTGPGVWPAAPKVFSVLIFLVLFASRQKGLASAAIERERV
jgi:hypothetical protein